eukprot:CAMPEP_0184360432 /NCGR_PEP_ID=MMETSP1089-20130417/124936_1 /TAXON_ID=38269 ORGANISM="Gloeochaete wittrockiana, Strain SAG46.84" /NCGR_SAMPLE_ID=MMETSP1089 /ASSEMBLY_ACC=CAM_ASM_000445 /LENGTH=98 /DNA_ID=CAMNT_0026699617 /DNA_START=73 /DNA_END=366 /DNA_ORIENTATION=+
MDFDDNDILKEQLEEEKRKNEEAKAMLAELKKELEELEQMVVKEREEHEATIDLFEQVTHGTTSVLKEQSARVKKMKDQFKKDLKSSDKKKKDKKKPK